MSQLKQQISTLTNAMATLTEEKSKMEANFQKDKRAMLVSLVAVFCVYIASSPGSLACMIQKESAWFLLFVCTYDPDA